MVTYDLQLHREITAARIQFNQEHGTTIRTAKEFLKNLLQYGYEIEPHIVGTDIYQEAYAEALEEDPCL